MFPKIELGPLHIQSFGLMVAIAFLFGRWYMMSRLAPRFSATPEPDRARLDSLSLWMLLGVVAGGRIMYVIVKWNEQFAHDPIRSFMIWEGGMVFYGGLIACFALGFWRLHAWRTKDPSVNLWNLADMVLVAGFLGLGIGRWGCLLVGDDHGRLAPEALQFFPLSVHVPNPPIEGSLFPRDTWGQWILCTQLYMSAGGFLLWGIGRFWMARRKFAGQITVALPIAYAVIRFLIEMVRGDDQARGYVEGFGPFERLYTSQIVSLVIVPVCLIGYVILSRIKPSLPDLATTDVAASDA